VREKDQ